MRPNPVRGYYIDRMQTHGRADEFLLAAGLDKKAALLRAAQGRAAAAYESGNLSEGDRQSARVDVLAEEIDNALLALEEEGEGQQEAPLQSLTRAMAEAWAERGGDEEVAEYRKTGVGEWRPPQFHQEGYYAEPGLLSELRDMLGYPDGPNADGRQLLDAAEDAWLASLATASRIRAGAARRRAAGVDPLREAKRFVRRVSRRR